MLNLSALRIRLLFRPFLLLLRYFCFDDQLPLLLLVLHAFPLLLGQLHFDFFVGYLERWLVNGDAQRLEILI